MLELALVEDAVVEGWECTECGYIAARTFDACPLCGARAGTSSNVLERAVERAYFSNAKVNFVYGEARERLLEKGGVGALLRY